MCIDDRLRKRVKEQGKRANKNIGEVVRDTGSTSGQKDYARQRKGFSLLYSFSKKLHIVKVHFH